MVMVKDLTELTLRDLWREVKDEEDWWGEINERTLNMVKLTLEGSLEEELLEELQVSRYQRSRTHSILKVVEEELIDVMVNGCEYARDEIRKPVFICVSLDPYSEDEEDRRYSLKVKKALESRQFPVYSSLDASIKALSNIYKYSMRFRLG